MSLHQIQKISVTDQVLFQLEREILWGTWGPGAQIPSEIAISRILQVSRSSVTAALDILRSKHILITLPGKGTFVSQDPDLLSFALTDILTPGEKPLIGSIVEFLQLVLAPAVQLAVERSSHSTLEKLEDLYRQMLVFSESPADFSRYDAMFYEEILICTANPLFRRMFANSKTFLSHTLDILDQLSDIGQRLHQHAQLLKCFENRDGVRARILMNQECHYFYMLLSEASHD
ncbi:MAG: FadR family transcriptional regulator [Lachnospiraceae bacterium]|nr:FadR family transcriptional regulator [Lachnospiraceae bacterium]